MSNSETQKSIPATSIKSLGGVAPEFDLAVHLPRLGIPAVELQLRARGMKKSEWAKLRDEHLQEERNGAKARTFVAYTKESASGAADLIVKALAGWQLEEALSVESLLALDDVIPGSLGVILEAIDLALFQGRLGN